MQYQVPQFIEIEDTVVGSLTLRQFIYLAGGAGLCIIFFFYLPLVPAVILSLPAAGLSAALSFYKVNGKPFINMIEAGFNYYTSAKLFLWQHQFATKKPDQQMSPTTDQKSVRKETGLTRGKISDLAWSLDVSTRHENKKQALRP